MKMTVSELEREIARLKEDENPKVLERYFGVLLEGHVCMASSAQRAGLCRETASLFNEVALDVVYGKVPS